VLGHRVLGDLEGTPDIHNCSFNVNAITVEKFSIILSVIKRLDIDLFVCIDTRQRESFSRRFMTMAQHILGSGANVLHSPIVFHMT